jgi:PAS domain S-box-containing protein
MPADEGSRSRLIAERSALQRRLAEIDAALGETGAPLRGDGIAVDVTDEKLTQRELEASERFLAGVLDGLTSALVVVGAEGEVVTSNASWRRAVAAAGGRPLGAACGPGDDYLVACDQAEAAAGPELARAIRGVLAGARDRFELEYREEREGGERWFLVRVSPVQGGGPVHAVVAHLDVTERARAHEALRKSEERLKHSQRIAHVGSWEWNIATGAVTWSEETFRLFGVDAADFVPSYPAFLGCVHPDDRALVNATVGASVQERKPYRVVHRALRPDGAVRLLEESGEVFCDATGTPVRLLGVAFDITARRQAEEALNRLNGELERRVAERTAELSLANAALGRASRAKDDFLASMSHELRTPLNAVLGLSEALQEAVYGPVAPRQHKALARIQESGRHLLELISDILDLSKIEAGRMDLDVAPVSVDDVCRQSLQLIQEAAQKKKQSVALQIRDGFTTLMADERRLRQVLVNLLSNAVKFTAEGGSIGLTAMTDDDGDQVRFTVWDSGIGIDAGDQARLFQSFVQLDSSLSRQHPGTGLGLAVVRRLVELHGGGVTVESEPGKGSRFSVALPRRRAGVAPGDAPRAAAGLPDERPRALIVEDSAPVAEQLARYVREAGLVPLIHGGGEGVVARAAAEQPRVILLDILLPAEVGWQILGELKADPRTQQIPVVVVSVLDREEEGRALGAHAHLTKPVSRERLLAVLAGIAQGSPQARPAPPPSGGGRPPEATAPRRILLAEDDETNVATVIDFLRARGHEVFVARNGEEAVRLAAELRPDLILMDVQMPVMDGLRATRAIRAHGPEGTRAVPIVAITALAMAGDRERCLAAGATEYLTKPVGLKRLASTIDDLLPRR